MAIQGNQKIIQISGLLTANTPEISLIQNNRFSSILGVQVPRQTFIHALQGWGEISSLDEAFLPIDDPKDSSMVRRQKREFFRASPKIGIEVRVQPIGAAAAPGKAAGYDFFPVKPGYLVDIFEYLTQADKFGLQEGWEIRIRQVNRGYGLLTGTDSISFTGWALENPEFLQDHNLNIIV